MIDTPTSGTSVDAAQTRLRDTRCLGTTTARVRSRGQIDAAKVDFAGVFGLGRNFSGGAWLRLSLSPRSRAGYGAGRMLEVATLDRFVDEEDMLA